MSLSRRSVLKLGVGAGASLLFDALPAVAQTGPVLIRKPIPSSGELIPVIGLGSSQTFDLTPDSPEWGTAREVVKEFQAIGGRVIDTAPSYRHSEEFLGRTVQDFRLQHNLFLATKVNVVSGTRVDALQQMENSSRVFGRRAIDLMQVWNLGDTTRSLTDAFLATHMEAVAEWKASGRARYIGITTSRDPQYGDIEAAMKKYRIDFVQLDYSIADRVPEQRLLPLARDRGIAVLVNRPFSAASLFRRVPGKTVPTWAAEFDCSSWAQFFLKFIVAHPAVTCAIPATGDPAHLRDNMGAARGRLPSEAMRRRMAEYFATL